MMMTNEGLIDGTPTVTFKLLMRSIEDKEEEIMSIPNELYQPMNKSKNRNMSDRESYFDRESYYDFTIPPNDLFFNDQWPFHKMNNHADINIEEGWKTYLSATDNSDNGKEVIIAVIDSGIDYTHPDLKEAMWKNPGEIPNNGIDDDNNGYIDDIYGVDFTGENQEGDPMDTHGHGTHCAGIIYAKPNGGGDIGAGVTSYTNGKVNIYHFLFKYATYMYSSS